MKKILCFIILLSLSYNLYSSDKKVLFPDSNLETVIRSQLGKDNTGPILEKDLESMTILNAARMNISDLGGLEYCAKLEYLNLESNNIQDLKALKELCESGVISRGAFINLLDNPALRRPPMKEWNDLMDDFLYLIAEGIDCLLFPEQKNANSPIIYIVDAGTKKPLFDLGLELNLTNNKTTTEKWSYPGLFFTEEISGNIGKLFISFGQSLKKEYKLSWAEVPIKKTNSLYDNDNVILVELYDPDFCVKNPDIWFGTGKPSYSYNLAAGKPWRIFPVLSSEEDPYNSNSIDDGSQWSSQEFHYSSSSSGWIEIDMLENINPEEIRIVLGGYPWGWQETEYRLSTSTDGKSWETAAVVENPEDRITLIKYTGKAFRYLRAELTRKSYFGDSAFYEIGVYNRHDETRDFWVLDPYPNLNNTRQTDFSNPGEYFRPILNARSEFYNYNAAGLERNLAVAPKLWATERMHAGEDPAFAFDGDPSTALWNHFIPSKDNPFIIIADFDKPYPVDNIDLDLIHSHSLMIEGSTDLKHWQKIENLQFHGGYSIDIPEKSFRYIRFTFTPGVNQREDELTIRFDVNFIGLKEGKGFELSKSGRLTYEKMETLSAETIIPDELLQYCGYIQYVIRKPDNPAYWVDFIGTSLTRFPALPDGQYIIEARPVWEPQPPENITTTNPDPIPVKIVNGKSTDGDRLEFTVRNF